MRSIEECVLAFMWANTRDVVRHDIRDMWPQVNARTATTAAFDKLEVFCATWRGCARLLCKQNGVRLRSALLSQRRRVDRISLFRRMNKIWANRLCTSRARARLRRVGSSLRLETISIMKIAFVWRHDVFQWMLSGSCQRNDYGRLQWLLIANIRSLIPNINFRLRAKISVNEKNVHTDAADVGPIVHRSAGIAHRQRTISVICSVFSPNAFTNLRVKLYNWIHALLWWLLLLPPFVATNICSAYVCSVYWTRNWSIILRERSIT